MRIVILDGYTANPGDLSWEEIAAQGESVQESLGQVQTFYTPRHVALSALQRFALDNHLYTIGINAVRGLRKLLEK